MSLVFCGLLTAGMLAAPARAANSALVSGVEKYLTDEEKALLAALLTRPAESAEFDSEAGEALKDPKILKLFLDKWRGKTEAFAETDKQRPNPDLEKTYRSYAEMLTPEIRAYLERRLGSMSPEDRNDLIGYLKSINKSLAEDGRLSWYTKKVVAGVLDRYRRQLTEYVATPLAQEGKRNAPAAAASLAQRRAESVRLAQAERAKTQAEAAARAAQAAAGLPDSAAAASSAGESFDGNSAGPGPGAVAAGPSTVHPPTLQPSAPGGAHAAAEPPVPSPATEDKDFMSRIEGLQTKLAALPLTKLIPGGLGAAILGAAGYLIAGPGAAIACAIAGAALGHLAGRLLKT